MIETKASYLLVSIRPSMPRYCYISQRHCVCLDAVTSHKGTAVSGQPSTHAVIHDARFLSIV